MYAGPARKSSPGRTWIAANSNNTDLGAQAYQYANEPWHGWSFAVQVEFYEAQGAGDESDGGFGGRSSPSLPKDTSKYRHVAKVLQDAIHSHFDGMVPVMAVPVETVYALEVAVVPNSAEASLPRPKGGGRSRAEDPTRRGRRGPPADAKPTHIPRSALVFSKLETQSWPRVQEVLHELRRFCQLPVSLQLVRAPPTGSGGPPAGQPAPAGVEVCVAHAASGNSVRAASDADGVVLLVLFPGAFEISLPGSTPWDSLAPGRLVLPALFRPVQETVVSAEIVWSTLVVKDHTGRAVTNFPLEVARESEIDASASSPRLPLCTDEAACCRVGLPTGDYVLLNATDLEDPPMVEPFRYHFTAAIDRKEEEVAFDVVVTRNVFPVEVLLQSVSGTHMNSRTFVATRAGDRDGGRHCAAVTGCTDENGVAAMQLTPGSYELRLSPMSSELPEEELSSSSRRWTTVGTRLTTKGGAEEATWLSSAVPAEFGVDLDGNVNPKVLPIDENQWGDVNITFLASDGTPADFCTCSVTRARRDVNGDDGRMLVDTGGASSVALPLARAETYTLRIEAGEQLEYVPQVMDFTADGLGVTLVVRRSLLGRISEMRFLVALDASAFFDSASTSPQGQQCDLLSSVALALEGALSQPQLNGSGKRSVRFNILVSGPGAATESGASASVCRWRPALVDAEGQAQDAFKWLMGSSCTLLPEAGSGSGRRQARAADVENAAPLRCLQAALDDPEAQAIYFITAAHAELDMAFLKRVQMAFYSTSHRPRIHTVLLNGRPHEPAWKHMQALALLTRASFRNVSI